MARFKQGHDLDQQYLLRHTSATYWANKLPYFKFCKRFGWTMTSNMPQRYIDREGTDELDVANIYHDLQEKQTGPTPGVPDMPEPTHNVPRRPTAPRRHFRV